MNYKKFADTQLSLHLNQREMDCPCHRPECNTTIVDDDLPILFERLRAQLGNKIIINSGFRCQAHQDDLKASGFPTAAGVSTHTLGMAIDIQDGIHSGPELEIQARTAGFRAVGVAPKWVHIDLRDHGLGPAGRDRSWTYRA